MVSPSKIDRMEHEVASCLCLKQDIHKKRVGVYMFGFLN